MAGPVNFTFQTSRIREVNSNRLAGGMKDVKVGGSFNQENIPVVSPRLDRMENRMDRVGASLGLIEAMH